MPPNFKEDGPHYSVNLGHVLPPSLEDANAGEEQGDIALASSFLATNES